MTLHQNLLGELKSEKREKLPKLLIHEDWGVLVPLEAFVGLDPRGQRVARASSGALVFHVGPELVLDEDRRLAHPLVVRVLRI